MVTRRQTVIGLISAATGGAVLTSSAFSSSVSAGADMRVVVVTDLQLEPARSEEARGEKKYVQENEAGEIEIQIDSLNRRALSAFGELVRVVNNGDVTYDELWLEFETVGGTDISEALGIISDTTVTEDNGVFKLYENQGALGPGDTVTFGIDVNLLPSANTDLPTDSSAELTLRITAVQN